MQDGESAVFLEDHSYPTIWNHRYWNTVGRSPLSRTWLCLARKSRSFRCHKTRRHISMMILLLMLSGDVEINPGPVTGRNQSEQRGPSSQPPTVPHPPHPEPTPPSSTLDDERSRKLKQVRKSLQSFYSNQLRTVQCTPDVEFVKPTTVEREYHRTKQKKEIEEFLQASIHGIDRYCGSSERIEYEDILNCGEVVSRKRKRGKRVLITGAPGCGKTTLSRKLCKDLYSQSLLNQYHLVLLVELRWLRLWLNTEKEDIDLEFLFTQYQEILNTSDLCQLLKRNSGEGVALILDGFDEIADQLGNSRFFANLLSVDSPYLGKCDVVITTRPSRCHDLIFLMKRPSCRVEILGFTDAGIDNYIKSFCNGVCKKDARRAQCMTDEMIKKLNSRPLLRGICRIPRALEILCKVNEYLGSDPLPETRSGIFSTYICHQLVNYLETVTERMPSICVKDVLDVPTDKFPGFYSLCEVAYKCCIDKKGQRLILTVEDLGDVKRYLDNQGSIYNLLFSEEVSPIFGVLYQFNHKTVQETLAAIHIAKLNDHEMFWKEHFCRPEMAEVWTIYCGLTKLINVDLKELSYSVLSQHAREVVDQEFLKDDEMVVMTSLFEADNSSLSREIIGDLFKTSITAAVASPYDAQVVRYSLQHHPTLQKLDLSTSSTADAVLIDELMPILMPRLRELRCGGLSESEWKTLSKAFVRAQHLETILLQMGTGDGEPNVPSQVEAVLSALTKLPTLKTFTLDLDQVGSEGLLRDYRRIVEALEANNCLRGFHLIVARVEKLNPYLSTITEHFCRNETLSEVTIDSHSGLVVPVQLLKSLLVHREKCTVKVPLTRQQWCAVLSGLRDAKKLKELVVYMNREVSRSSIPDQSDQCLISSDEVEELVAASEHLVKVEVGYLQSRPDVGDLVLSMVKGVSRNKNISELGVVTTKGIMSAVIDPDSLRSVVVPILEITAANTNHITCVNFECMETFPMVTILGDDWCQLLVDGPMSRRECHLELVLTPAQCGQLLSTVNDAQGLEELSLKMSHRIPIDKGPHNVCDNDTVEAVEEVYSNCRLRKMRLQIELQGDNVDYTNLWVAVVRGIAFNNNDIDFVLEEYELNRDHIMSQLPPQSVERFEVVERRGREFIISKPCAPTVASSSPSTFSLPSTTSEVKISRVSSAPKKSSSSSTLKKIRTPVISVAKKKSTSSTELREERDCPTSYSSNSAKTKKRSPLPSTSRGLRGRAQPKTSANSKSTKASRYPMESPSQSTPSPSPSTPRAKRPRVSLASKPAPSTSRVLRPRPSKKTPTPTPRTSNPAKTKKRSPLPSTSRVLRHRAQPKTSANSRSTKASLSQKKSDNEFKDVIKSTSDLLPYMDKMIAHLTLLGTVLGVEEHTSAIVNGPGNFEEKCINILSHWLKVTPHPTWTMFCDRLKTAKTFNSLRSKICRDKSC